MCARSGYLLLLAAVLAVAPGLQSSAEDRPAAGEHYVSSTPSDQATSGTQTGKERLGRKWMDEQRVDDCKVPLDKRGPKRRPDSCASVPGS